MGPIEWFRAQEPAVQVGLVVFLVVSFVAFLVMLVAGVVVGAAVIGSFVLALGEDVDEEVRAEVDVAWDPDAGEIRVTYVSAPDESAEIEVHVEETDDAGGTPYRGDERVVLALVGDQAVFSGAGVNRGDTFHVTVTAFAADGRSTVIYEESRRL